MEEQLVQRLMELDNQRAELKGYISDKSSPFMEDLKNIDKEINTINKKLMIIERVSQ